MKERLSENPASTVRPGRFRRVVLLRRNEPPVRGQERTLLHCKLAVYFSSMWSLGNNARNRLGDTLSTAN